MTTSSHPPAETRDTLVTEYAHALHAYLGGGGETALARAYELGRAAVASGVGVVELALVHHAALSSLTPGGGDEAQTRAATFLAESLSPYEMTHRGFQDAAARLEELNRSLRQKNEELRATAASLRQAKEAAEAANGELEAFSYSVSHDLRAPLRSIDGFSHALLEEYADRLDEKGLGYLERVRSAVRRMGQLIDDLLQLARVGRSELSLYPTDLSAIARSVVDDLRVRTPEAKAAVDVEAGVTASVDSRLIRIVFENLLGNAWKFTAKAPDRRIAFGTEKRPEGLVYFVRDNGAGFNMAYAGRLFSPFQRLHSEADFPGTGIGLATVRRIVNRHGGRAWAESAVGQGATIFFTLAP